MTEEVTMQPDEEGAQEQAQVEETQAQETQAEVVITVGDVIAVNPYASQAHLPDENRIWPPPPVKNHG